MSASYLELTQNPRIKGAHFGLTNFLFSVSIILILIFIDDYNDYAKDWKVNGVIMQSVKYCDTHGYEVPGMKDYLEGVGLPVLFLEHEYTLVALASLQTRAQAFLEIMRVFKFKNVVRGFSLVLHDPKGSHYKSWG
jgi:hypothetical protein